MDSLSVIIIGLLIIFFAGVTQGLTGFGFALVSVPIMTIFLSPKIVVPIILLHGTLISLAILYEARKWINLKGIWPLMIAGIVGMPLGTYLLIILEPEILKIFIGSAIVLFALAFLKGLKKKIKDEKWVFVPVGFISGLLKGSIAMAGPPVTLFFTSQGLNKDVFRASLVAYFTALNLATVPTYVLGGLITKDVINYAILFLPAMILGGITGIKLAHRIQERLFRNIVLIILIVAGVISVASGLGIL